MLSLLNALDVGFAISDSDGRIVSADRVFSRILRRPLDRVVGLTIGEMVHPDDLALNLWLFNQAKRARSGFDLRKRYLLEDNGVQWVENRVSCLAGLTAEPVYLICSRRIEEPKVMDPDAAPRSWSHMAYAADIATQLAQMLGENAPGLGAELLDLAASALDAQAGGIGPLT